MKKVVLYLAMASLLVPVGLFAGQPEFHKALNLYAKNKVQVNLDRLEKEYNSVPTAENAQWVRKATGKTVQQLFGSPAAAAAVPAAAASVRAPAIIHDISPRGLQNLGNTCYMNAVLQCVYAVQPFTQHFLHNQFPPNSTSAAYRQLLREITAAKPGASIEPKAINTCAPLKKGFRFLGNEKAQDAQEFLNALLDQFATDSPDIKELFTSRVSSTITCIPSMHQPLSNIQSYFMLSLPIDGTSLGSCLEAFFASSPIAHYRGCPANTTQVLKTLALENAAEIMIIHLTRFDEARNKDNTSLNIPLESKLMQASPDAPLYDLIGFVIHHGDSAGGHYMACVKLGNNWFFCNDRTVHNMTLKDVQSALLNDRGTPYILFYQRRSSIERDQEDKKDDADALDAKQEEEALDEAIALSIAQEEEEQIRRAKQEQESLDAAIAASL